MIGNLFLHKPISNVCDGLFARLGRGPYERGMLVGIAILSLGGALLLLRGRLSSLLQPRIAMSLVALAAMSIGAQRWLLVSNVELIHLPQFGLLAALLLAAGIRPQTAWIGATAGGVLDETYQWLVIYANVPGTYFDYNDIILNAIGAAWVVVLAGAGRADDAAPAMRRWLRVVLGLLVFAFALALWLAPPRLVATDVFPYWRLGLARALTGFDYHVMPASEGLASLLVIWALVAVATRGAGHRPLSAAARAAAMLLVLLSACRPLPGPPASPDMPMDGTEVPSAVATSGEGGGGRGFIITFLCGPPLHEFTDARAAEIAAAGFNVVGAPCEGRLTPALNRRALEIAARHGLTLWIADNRVGQPYELSPDWEAQLAEVIADYGDQPALGGYFLVDEPNAARFPDLAKVVARLRTEDPGRIPYINLLPDFASPERLGTATYREHVEQFAATVRPPLLSFDYYPFKLDEDRATFFDNLSLVRAVAQANRVPFLLIVQAMPHGRYRDPTAAEIAWQVNHALAFGAGGISYFAYWTPRNVSDAARWQFRHGLIEEGRPTVHFAQATRINRAVRAYAAQLDGFTSTAVADSAGRFGTPLPIDPIDALEGGPVTAGFFARRDERAVMLVNQDYLRSQRIVLRLPAGTSLPEAFEPTAARWHRLASPVVSLPPGGAQLLRWT